MNDVKKCKLNIYICMYEHKYLCMNISVYIKSCISKLICPHDSHTYIIHTHMFTLICSCTHNIHTVRSTPFARSTLLARSTPLARSTLLADNSHFHDLGSSHDLSHNWGADC